MQQLSLHNVVLLKR